MWDKVSDVSPGYHVKKYKNFSMFENKKENKTIVDISGFTLTSYLDKNKYTLSLHLGTSDNLMNGIMKSLKTKFKNVKKSKGSFVTVIKFTE